LTLHEEIWKQLKKENKKKTQKEKRKKTQKEKKKKNTTCMLLFLFACEYKTFDVFFI